MPGGAFRSGDQFQKETPGFIHFFVQKSPEAGRNILCFLAFDRDSHLKAELPR